MNPTFPAHSTDAARRVEHEHLELRRRVGEITQLFDAGHNSGLDIHAELESFCDQLESHFHTEDHGGFFAEIVEKDPRFDGEATRLSNEHATLLSSFRRLRDRIATGEPARWWEPARNEMHQLAKELMHHESDENSLLQQAYWDDIGSKD